MIGVDQSNVKNAVSIDGTLHKYEPIFIFKKTMNHATIDNLDEIMDVFKQYKDIFPHIRSDKIQRMIESNNVVWEEKVLITYNHYQRKQRVGK